MLLTMGVSQTFAAKAFSAASSELCVPDRATLLSEHIVTQIVDGQSFSSAANGELTLAEVQKIMAAVRPALQGAIIDDGLANPSNVVPSEQEAAAGFGKLWVQVRDAGFDLSTVGRSSQSVAEQRAACLALSRFMQAMAQLPIQTSGPLMRRLARNH